MPSVQDFLPFRVSICGLDELPNFFDDDVTHIVSILAPPNPDPDCFDSFGDHKRIDFRFDDVVEFLPDKEPVGHGHIEDLLDFGAAMRDEAARHLVVHCMAGVSRSTAAVAILMAQNRPGHETDIFDAITSIRTRNWPNSRMITLADELLDCGGALIGALRDHHRTIAYRHPDLAQAIRDHGRAHEVPDDIAAAEYGERERIITRS